MPNSVIESNTVTVHPLDQQDAVIVGAIRSAVAANKGQLVDIASQREGFDVLMERVPAPEGVAFERGVVGDISGFWAHPRGHSNEEAILHFHGGWFNFGSARAYLSLVGQVAKRAGVSAFIPEYRLAPEHRFPAAVDDAVACFKGMRQLGFERIAVTGDSAGGNLALGLVVSIVSDLGIAQRLVVAAAALSPVTDLALTGESYTSRAGAELYFTRRQVQELIHSYLGNADDFDPQVSPLFADLMGLPPVRIHVGDAEVLLDDSRRFAERALLAGVDVRLDVWEGMPHGFQAGIGSLKAAAQSMEILGAFLSDRLCPSNS